MQKTEEKGAPASGGALGCIKEGERGKKMTDKLPPWTKAQWPAS